MTHLYACGWARAGFPTVLRWVVMKLQKNGSMQSDVVRWVVCPVFLLGIAAGIGGCGIDIPQPPSNGIVDGNTDCALTSPLGKTCGEPNDIFASAVAAVFDSSGRARLQGTVSVMGDLDVFLLGALSRGDRLVVDATTGGSALDVSVAIFDSAERIVMNNDDRSETPVLDLDAYVDWIVRHSSDRYYLVVTHSAFASSSRFTGAYAVDVRVTSGHEVPEVVG